VRVVIALLLSVTAAQAAAETKFYHCKDKWGQPVFSERPCGADAAAGSVEAPPVSGSVAPEDMSKVSASNSLRDAERQVEYLEDRIDRYESERDRKLADLERRSNFANNNLAGAQYQESLATERQAVTAQYQSKIDADNEKIRRLRDLMEKTSEVPTGN
jgi:hypothetical protein